MMMQASLRALSLTLLLLPLLTRAEPPAVEAFFANPRAISPRMSPTGKQSAVLLMRGDEQIVMLASVGGKPEPIAKIDDPRLRFAWMEWESDDLLLLLATQKSPWSIGYRGRAGRLYVLDPEDRKLQPVGGGWAVGSIIHWLPREPGYVLIGHGTTARRLHVTNGKSKLVQGSIPGIGLWHADRDGNVRVGEGFDRTRYRLSVKGTENGPFEVLQDYDIYEGTGFSFAGYSDDPNKLLVHALSDTGYVTVREFDLIERKLGVVLFSDPAHDAGYLEVDQTNGKVLAVNYAADGWERHFVDDQSAAEYAAIERALGGTIVFEDRTEDGRFAILTTSSDVAPPSYHLYDRRKRTLDPMFRTLPALDGVPLSSWRSIAYIARDGLRIPAYLTLPPGAEAKALPTIVLVHGGPTSRVVRQWDPEVQFLASRGFAVFQPNFRGSSGYGRDFEVAGYRQWGLAMQDDVTDGVKWLIAEGIADPDRIGIYGGSYGGYSAMMGLVREPGMFRAGASYAGVMSLPMLLDDDQWQGLQDHNVPRIGGGWADRKRLAETSPLGNVSAISVPVLLGHGENDERVHVRHSRRMADSLRDAGKSIEYLEFQSEVHGFLLEANRVRWYAAVAAFFEKYLAPRAKQAGNPRAAPGVEHSGGHGFQ